MSLTYINTCLQKISTSSSIMKEMNAFRPSHPPLRPKGLEELTTLLKKLNRSDDPRHGEHKSEGREWLSKKGFNLAPIVQKIMREKEVNARDQFEPTSSDDYFHVKLELSTIPEYVQKCDEYSTMNLMQYSMKNKRRRKFTSKYLGAMIQEGPNNFSMAQGDDNREKRNAYIQIVKNLVERRLDKNVFCRQLVKELRASMGRLDDNYIWDILSHQLEQFKEEQPIEINTTKMLVVSLKLINQEFQRKMHNEDHERFISKNFIAKIEGKYAFERSGYWARIWLYYCLGMRNDIINLLSSGIRDYRDLVQLYINSEDALNQGKPIKDDYVSRYDIQDVFFDQFIFSITGQSRYSCGLMGEPLSLQLPMIVIRTLGVYDSDWQKYEQIRGSMMKNYKNFTCEPQVIRNMLYLMDYDQLVKTGPNSLMTYEDYLHFLIVLSGYGQLVDSKKLREVLSQMLVKIVMELISEKKKEYIHYISLFPEEHLISNVSSILLTADAIDQFDWKGLERLLDQDAYIELVLNSVEKFRLRSKNELKAAQKVKDLIEDYDKALEYLLSMLISHYLNKYKYSKEDVNQAIRLGCSWSREVGVPPVYNHIFQFIKSYRQMNSLLAHRNDRGLWNFISNCDFILMENQKGRLNQGMLELLHKVRGVDLYFDFLLRIIKSAELYSSRNNDPEKLKYIKHITSNSLGKVRGLPKLRESLGSQYLRELNEELQSQLY